MKPKYIIPVVIVFGVVLGYNAFLIKRDTELFKAYDNQVKYDNLTTRETFCARKTEWHPDCDVE